MSRQSLFFSSPPNFLFVTSARLRWEPPHARWNTAHHPPPRSHKVEYKNGPLGTDPLAAVPCARISVLPAAAHDHQKKRGRVKNIVAISQALLQSSSDIYHPFVVKCEAKTKTRTKRRDEGAQHRRILGSSSWVAKPSSPCAYLYFTTWEFTLNTMHKNIHSTRSSRRDDQ